MVRTPDLHSGGHRFESCIAHISRTKGVRGKDSPRFRGDRERKRPSEGQGPYDKFESCIARSSSLEYFCVRASKQLAFLSDKEAPANLSSLVDFCVVMV